MKNLFFKKNIVIVFVSGFPMITLAQRTLKGGVESVVGLVGGVLMPLLFTFALTWFIWGVVLFIKDSDNPQERKTGKTRMMWGIFALFAMVTYLGLTSILTTSVFGASPFLPQFFTN
jgi:hypothetical protein